MKITSFTLNNFAPEFFFLGGGGGEQIGVDEQCKILDCSCILKTVFVQRYNVEESNKIVADMMSFTKIRKPLQA